MGLLDTAIINCTNDARARQMLNFVIFLTERLRKLIE